MLVNTNKCKNANTHQKIGYSNLPIKDKNAIIVGNGIVVISEYTQEEWENSMNLANRVAPL